jgi:hypothetical protein
MFALTVLYTGLFAYIRVRVKEFRKFTSTSDSVGALETGGSVHSKGSQAVMTKTVSAATGSSTNYRQPRTGTNVHQRMNYISYTLLLYPTVYIILTLPIAIARLYEFVGRSFTLRSLYIGAAMFDLQGFVNVILYTTTRKGIVPWDRIFGKFENSTPKTLQSTFVSNASYTHDPPTSPRSVVSKPSTCSIATSDRSNMKASSVKYYPDPEIDLLENFTLAGERTAELQNTVNDRMETDVCTCEFAKNIRHD